MIAAFWWSNVVEAVVVVDAVDVRVDTEETLTVHVGIVEVAPKITIG